MSNSTALCGVCCLRHLSKPSTGWCLECEEGLCSDCKEHHSLLKATQNHTILPISEYQKLPQNVLEITQNCRKHNEIFQIFCIKHDCPCCRKCIIETHNNCKDLIEIEDYIKDVKSSARCNELEEMLNETAENFKRIRINREENLTSLQEERKKIESDILQTRIKINNHLDKLQADLIQNLYAKVEKENEKIQQVLKSLEKKQCQIKEYQNTFENIKKYATDVQLFLSMKLMETNMVKEEEFIRSLIESESLCQVMLDLKDALDTKTIAVSMPYIGKIGIDYSPSQVSIIKKKEQQAQMMTKKATVKSFSNIAPIKIEKRIIAFGVGVTGCTLLPHGKIAFANEKESSIIVVTADGLLDFKIDLKPFAPFDITYISNANTIAVTSRNSNDIKIIDVNAKGVLKTYCLGSPSAGIAYAEKSLILCSKEKGILELNLRDGSVKTIVSDKMDKYSHVSLLGDKIYYTKSHNQSVICCDLQGNIQWIFQNREITGPVGVTVDTDRNVYVACNHSNNVVVISPDGKQHKQLLSDKDGVYIPHGLIYDRHNNQLLVTSYFRGAVLYNVT